jgi:type VI secretion system ImpM family protein
MLEIIGLKNSWNWGAFGKHPVGRDYFRVGPNDPFLKAFSDWVENGYRRLNAVEGSSPAIYSWRFWAKGPKKGSVVCGVGRDSSDSLGRPYPFLIMGKGPLKDWEEHWDLLPLAFEKTWAKIEHLATGRFVDFKQMEDEVRSIKPPEPIWRDFEALRGSPGGFESTLKGPFQYDLGEIEKKIEGLMEIPEILIPLKKGQSDGQSDFVSLLHLLVRKSQGGAVPNSIFMGGISDNTCLAVFMRPLASDDFIKLWSI